MPKKYNQQRRASAFAAEPAEAIAHREPAVEFREPEPPAVRHEPVPDGPPIVELGDWYASGRACPGCGSIRSRYLGADTGADGRMQKRSCVVCTARYNVWEPFDL